MRVFSILPSALRISLLRLQQAMLLQQTLRLPSNRLAGFDQLHRIPGNMLQEVCRNRIVRAPQHQYIDGGGSAPLAGGITQGVHIAFAQTVHGLPVVVGALFERIFNRQRQTVACLHMDMTGSPPILQQAGELGALHRATGCHDADMPCL